MALVQKGSEIKSMLIVGWELWYIHCGDLLPGKWEMRKSYRANRAVSWDAIIRARRDKKWLLENTVEEQDGENWIYMHRQRAFTTVTNLEAA